MYVKLFGTLLDSSIWAEDHATVRVWITLLLMGDKEGAVRSSPSGLARRANVTLAECHQAIKTLQDPDIETGTQEYGGRRIESVEGGWLLLNYEKYREIKTEAQLQAAARQRAKYYRDKEAHEKDDSVSSHAPHASSASASASVSQDGSSEKGDLGNGGESLAMVRKPTKTKPVKAPEIQLAIADIANKTLAGTKLRYAQVVVIFAYWVAKMSKDAKTTELSSDRFNRIEHWVKARNASWCFYMIDGSLKNKRLVQKDQKFLGIDNIFPYQKADRVEESVALTKFSRQPIHAMVVEHPEIQTAEERSTLAPQQGGGHE